MPMSTVKSELESSKRIGFGNEFDGSMAAVSIGSIAVAEFVPDGSTAQNVLLAVSGATGAYLSIKMLLRES
jgi:hypothetical protein